MAVVDAGWVAEDPGDDVIGRTKTRLFDACRAIQHGNVLALVGDEHHAAARNRLTEHALDLVAPCLCTRARIHGDQMANATRTAGGAHRKRHEDGLPLAVCTDVGEVGEVVLPEHAAGGEVERNHAMTLRRQHDVAENLGTCLRIERKRPALLTREHIDGCNLAWRLVRRDNGQRGSARVLGTARRARLGQALHNARHVVDLVVSELIAEGRLARAASAAAAEQGECCKCGDDLAAHRAPPAAAVAARSSERQRVAPPSQAI